LDLEGDALTLRLLGDGERFLGEGEREMERRGERELRRGERERRRPGLRLGGDLLRGGDRLKRGGVLLRGGDLRPYPPLGGERRRKGGRGPLLLGDNGLRGGLGLLTFCGRVKRTAITFPSI